MICASLMGADTRSIGSPGKHSDALRNRPHVASKSERSQIFEKFGADMLGENSDGIRR